MALQDWSNPIQIMRPRHPDRVVVSVSAIQKLRQILQRSTLHDFDRLWYIRVDSGDIETAAEDREHRDVKTER
jgi:hypothetical protein